MTKFQHIILVCILLISCVTSERFERKYATWISLNKNKLISAYGEPQKIIKYEDSRVEYVYNLSKSKKNKLPDTCIIYFMVDEENIIVSFRYEGNFCRRGPSFT